jgi:uncharacterized membrane protein
MTLLLVFLIGVLNGLRSLTPPAATAWAAHLSWLRLPRFAVWLGTTPAVVIFTVLALVELVNDKLPKTPSRTEPMGLIVRIIMGAFAGACLAPNRGQGSIIGALIGAAGAIAGTFAGHQARTKLVRALGTPDFVIAIFEDLVAVGGSLYIVSRF